MLPSQVAFEIKEYGKRNAQCHFGVRDLINNARWHELAELILMDKQTLGKVYQNDPHGRNGMLQCITNLQRQWFDTVYFDGNGNTRYNPSKKAIARTESLEHTLRRVGGQWSQAAQGASQVNPVVNGVGTIALP